MKPAHLMSASERRERLETSLENANYMLRIVVGYTKPNFWTPTLQPA